MRVRKSHKERVNVARRGSNGAVRRGAASIAQQGKEVVGTWHHSNRVGSGPVQYLSKPELQRVELM